MIAVKRTLVIAASLILAAAAGALLTLRASLARLDGELALDGLSAPVTVTRDALGVPTVRGRDRQDVARATGFVHAQERFFQMDLLRRVAAGELSALVGAAALDRDRALRVHGLRRVAARVVADAGDRHRALLDAYAAGVNAGLAALRARPPEYLILGSAPARWQAEDSVLAVLAMFLRLSDPDADTDARRGMLHECLPASVAAFLASDDPAWAATLDGGELTEAPLPAAAEYDLRRLAGVDFHVGRSVAATVTDDHLRPAAGSNAFAVAGSATADGRALVANDMHLGLGMPNIWYRMRLVVDGNEAVDVTGVTLPGGPAVVAGSNGRVAWGFTNAYGDWSDRVLVEPDPHDPSRYRTPRGTRAFQVRQETIRVKGGAPVTLPVRDTVWGPVIEDRLGRPVALRWIGHRPAAINLEILRLERVGSVTEALDAAPVIGIPPQNLVVGDADGAVGWTVAGRIPLRQPGYDPRRPHPGAAPDAGWDGWLPARDYPRIHATAHRRVWSANHQAVSGHALGLIGDSGYAHGARARQIRDALLALDRADEADMLAIQLDDRARLLDRWHRLLSGVLEAGGAAAHPRALEFREILAGWSGRASADAVAYRLVAMFRLRLHDVVFAAITAPCRALDPEYRFVGLRQDEGPLWRLVTEQPVHLLHPGHASWPALLDSVASEVMQHLESFSGPLRRRTWGEHNVVHLRHSLSRGVPALGPLLDTGPHPGDGDRDLPRVQAHGAGASERFAVRPGAEADGYFHMPGGQSGHFLSPHYRAGHEAWRTGAPTPFLPGPDAHRLMLVPAQVARRASSM